ncbi:MAG: helicase-related protein [Planctomycetota bacterium]|jgi:superfamily II DNA or RNA helicase
MTTLDEKFTPGTFVRARGREWLVLPESTEEILLVRPAGGLDEEVTGIAPAVEPIETATFPMPRPGRPGDHNSCRLLRDAARLSTRAAAGPFRSFGRIAVEPRPYQLVPLMMAMRLDPLRLLIADDVGIGKTVEALLIARELLDRGEVMRLAVLCPPHLAEQWQREMAEKFHIDATLVLSSTVQRLERNLPVGVSVFDRHRYVIVSTDFIKAPKRRDDFLRTCPELVIVDEAHTCTIADRTGRARQYRHELVKGLSRDETRHLVLVTATPHSGKEQAFRSLLSLLDPRFADLPENLDARNRERQRRRLAQHLVQRRRGDIRHYLETDTQFPEREDAELTYTLSTEYRSLFDKILAFAREMVTDESGNKRHQRVRWWSALALLRALASSPAAAAATLRNRARTADAADAEEADEIGRRAVLDMDDAESAESMDLSPGGNTALEDALAGEDTQRVRNRLNGYARQADSLCGKADNKLKDAIKQIKRFLKDGFQPIVFCRFIETAEYVARELRDALPKKVEVAAVTGKLPPAEREERVANLIKHTQHVLVCTDCLSEGVNLQVGFDAVMHYDLSWNPTRHEQREGRVDRFGQDSPIVRVLTYWGKDNGVDGVVLDVLINKHKAIKSDLGISVAVPGSSESVIEAIFEGIELRRQQRGALQLYLPGMDPTKEALHTEWENAAETEKRSRSRYAHHTLDPSEVAAELTAIRESIGAGPVAQQFIIDALKLARVPVTPIDGGAVSVGLSLETPRSLRQSLGRDDAFTGRFDLPVKPKVLYLARTSPVVEGLATWVVDTALDEDGYDAEPIARRCGVVRTDVVSARTTLLLVRNRYHLALAKKKDRPLLAEEVLPLAFTGTPGNPAILDNEAVALLMTAKPTGNLTDSLVRQQLDRLFEQLDAVHPLLDSTAAERATALLDAHTRVRNASRVTGQVTVQPVLPVDILGCFVYLPS